MLLLLSQGVWHGLMQGEIIDRIEDEVAETGDYVETGKKELVEAANHRHKARKVGVSKIMCLLQRFVCLFPGMSQMEFSEDLLVDNFQD